MKKLLSFILLFITLISCDKESGNLKHLETIPGGCALEKASSFKSVLEFKNDTVSYSITNRNLDLFVGFNATCCGQYSTSSEIKENTIFCRILTTKIGNCYCDCYYTYNFRFTGSGNNYKYEVTIDGNLKFTGQIKP
jgi:hypothetical protein